MKTTAKNHYWEWLDYLAIMVATVSIVSITLLITDSFHPKQAFFIGGSLATIIFSFAKMRSISTADGQGLGFFTLFSLILFAAVFRLEPYPWINGGQDQGVYVSMSAYYQKGGNLFITDPISDKLSNETLKTIYKENLPEGSFQPGVFYSSRNDYVFQFYHLHPLWMAIFADFLGDGARIYSLTFFSLLSIIFLSLLAFELSGSRAAALAVGILLAVNPLHAFFSKWPVTEIVALAFSSMAFYYLARAYRLADYVVPSRWALGISCLSLSMLFFVRISGFLYLPALLLVFMVGTWFYQVHNNRFGKDLAAFSVACICLYVLSVFYGLSFSPNYSIYIYRSNFGRFANGDWILVMSVILIFMLLTMYVWHSHLCHAKVGKKFSFWLQPNVFVVFLVVITVVASVFSLHQVYLLGYTDTFASNSWLGSRWKLSGSGIAAVERSSVLNWILYSSPFLVAVGIVALLKRGADWKVALLLVVPVTAMLLFFLRTIVLPYQYYYARYLLTEAVPYIIIVFVVVTIGSGIAVWRRAGIAAVALSVLWFGYLTIQQFGAEEGIRPLNVLKQIATHVDQDDVLLIEPSGWSISSFHFETPLRFYFGIKMFTLPHEQRKLYAQEISGSFRRVFLLTPKPIEDDHFILIDRLLHFDRVMERSGHIPLKIVDNFWRQDLYLYEMKKIDWPSGVGWDFLFDRAHYPVSHNNAEIAKVLGDGWHSIEARHVWSTGRSEIKLVTEDFRSKQLPDFAVLEIAPFAASANRPIVVYVASCGDYEEQLDFRSAERISLRIPITVIDNQAECMIRFKIDNVHSPKQLGQSGDTRELGIALYAITFE